MLLPSIVIGAGVLAAPIRAPGTPRPIISLTATAVVARPAPEIDGRQLDVVWRSAPKFTGFPQFAPRVSLPAGSCQLHSMNNKTMKAVAVLPGKREVALLDHHFCVRLFIRCIPLGSRRKIEMFELSNCQSDPYTSVYGGPF